MAGHGSDLLAQWPRADGAATHPWAHSVAPGVADLPDNVIEFDEPLRRQPDLDLDRGVVAAKDQPPVWLAGVDGAVGLQQPPVERKLQLVGAPHLPVGLDLDGHEPPAGGVTASGMP